jgi:hypothetical protein
VSEHSRGAQVPRAELGAGALLLLVSLSDVVLGLHLREALTLVLGLAGVVVFLAWLVLGYQT